MKCHNNCFGCNCYRPRRNLNRTDEDLCPNSPTIGDLVLAEIGPRVGTIGKVIMLDSIDSDYNFLVKIFGEQGRCPVFQNEIVLLPTNRD